MFPDTCIICTDTSGKDWNRWLPKLLFTDISKNWDPRHRDPGGIRDPRLETHLRSEIWNPRSETLNVRLKNWDSHRARVTSQRTSKLNTGIQDPGHLSCLWFVTQDPYQNSIKDTVTRFQKYIFSDMKAQDLNSQGQEIFA